MAGQYDKFNTRKLFKFSAISLTQFCDIWHHYNYNTFNFLPNRVANIDIDESVNPSQ